ncbi:hypothetical protein NDU88_007011 [Pleurodeles waltl]|uniref:Uncharacterized protein n=1 Tax=Pleurodeles waltl TaxID=8319 RepID=A0AAV7UN67_PLEWA|nr:hypothetical protein NDU88_007011 [Pleurodeles waltl]
MIVQAGASGELNKSYRIATSTQCPPGLLGYTTFSRAQKHHTAADLDPQYEGGYSRADQSLGLTAAQRHRQQTITISVAGAKPHKDTYGIESEAAGLKQLSGFANTANRFPSCTRKHMQHGR